MENIMHGPVHWLTVKKLYLTRQQRLMVFQLPLISLSGFIENKQERTKTLNITIVGAGYVGLSTAVNFARKHNVITLDISEDIVNNINHKQSHLKEEALKKAFEEPLQIRATTSVEEAYKNCDVAIIAVPTNYDDKVGKFDTSWRDFPSLINSGEKRIRDVFHFFICESV